MAKPIENINFPGFYEIPEYGKYLISKEGKVVKKETGEEVLNSPLKKGYRIFNLIDDSGIKRGCGRHRLLATVFKHPGTVIENLVVNHRDGIPGSDDLTNLEWTTHQGNIEHAGMHGLTTKCIPISVRDVFSGVVVEYPSIIACAREFGWTKDRVLWRVKIGEGRVFPEGKQYRPARVKKPWFIPVDIDQAVLENSRSRVTLIRDAVTGKVKEYPSLSKAAQSIGVSKAALSIWVCQNDMPVLPGFIQVKFAHDPRPWRPVQDPYLEFELTSSRRVIRVMEKKTGLYRFFGTVAECAREMGLKPTALCYRLLSRGKTVFKDGFCYAYYTDVVDSTF